MRRVVVIGGGAAGLIASIFSAKKDNQVLLLEKNEKLGKKIYITGKGRCNLTNDVEPNEYLNNVVVNPKFMYGSIYAFSPSDTMSFFEENGLSLKTERGNRVFPLSDKASDVTKTLERVLAKLGVDIRLNTEVKDILVRDNKVYAVKTDKEEILCDSVIVCTGGLSYSLTGSTGDGYAFAKKLGHNIIPLKPALVGMELNEQYLGETQGLSLKNVTLTMQNGDKKVFSKFGEMLFTHFGISGPLVLTCSSYANKLQPENVKLFIDFKPALDVDTLNARLLREFETFNLKSVANAIRTLLPQSLVNVVLAKANIKRDKKCAEITVNEREKIIKTLKNFELKYKKLRPIEESVVTSGGVDVREINPKTMESKIVSGLFFAGEVIDVDCFTGGFNLQTAFSTGFVAGNNS